MLSRSFFAFAALSLSAVAPANGQAADDLASKIINDPSAPSVNGAKASLHDDPAAQGGKALRVQVPKKGANVWDSAVETAIPKPIKAGDQLVLMVSARLEKGEGGATATTIPYVAVQLASEPYSSLLQQSVDIGPEWKDFQIRGTADRDYPANSVKVTVHLATAKQTVDVGPIVLLDLGPKK